MGYEKGSRQMADSSIFMSFEGVDGSATGAEGISNSPAGAKWIALSSCSLSGNNRGGYGAEKTAVAVEPIVVTKLMDSASVLLFGAFINNKPSKNVVITHVRVSDPGEGGKEYLRYELTDAQIVEFRHEGSDGPPVETLAVTFGNIEITSWDYDKTSQAAPAMISISNEV